MMSDSVALNSAVTAFPSNQLLIKVPLFPATGSYAASVLTDYFSARPLLCLIL